jgi:hypothetical protein
MQLQAMICYSYIRDMILITQFLKSNIDLIQFYGHSFPTPE